MVAVAEPSTEETPSANDHTSAAVVISSTTPDKRAELQDLINKSAASKQALYLPAGRFIISNELLIPSNTTIVGKGASTEIILTDGIAAKRNVFRITSGSSNIKLKDLKLNANQPGNIGADLVALFVHDRVAGLDFENVTFEGGRDRGVVQIKGLNATPVTDIKFLSCTFPLAGRTSIELRGTKNVTINKCVFSNWGTQNPNSPAIQLQSQENINVQIFENTFNNTKGIQFAIECAAAYVSDSKITNNKLNDPQNRGGNGISGYFKNTEISNNVLTGGNGNQRSGLEIFGSNNRLLNNTISAGLIAISPGFSEDGTNVLIQGNSVKSKGQNASGILMGNGGYNLNNIRVVGNSIDTRSATGNSSGIVVGTYGARRVVNNITVEGNTIWSNAFCIRLESLPGSSDIFLRKNLCKAGMSWLGIVTNTFSNVQASGNTKEMAEKGVIYSTSMAPISEN